MEKSEIHDEINKNKNPNSAKGPDKGKIVNKLYSIINKGNNKITELRTILQRESQNS
jgi:hypothetical protein